MKHLLKIFISLLLMTLFSLTVEAKTVPLEQKTTNISLLEHSELFIDVGAKRSYVDIKNNTLFVKADTDFIR